MRPVRRACLVRPLRPVLLALALAGIAGCAPSATTRSAKPAPAQPSVAAAWEAVVDRLYLGRSTRSGGTVSDAQWETFVREVVAPRLSGWTLYSAEGQWSESGKVVRESTFVLEYVHAPGAPADSALAAVAEEYIRRFDQSSVLRVTTPARTLFYVRPPEPLPAIDPPSPASPPSIIHRRTTPRPLARGGAIR